MSHNTDELLTLPAAEKLRLIELLWDGLGDATTPIPLPDWVDDEAARRRAEMLADPSCGVEHDEVWRRIRQRNG